VHEKNFVRTAGRGISFHRQIRGRLREAPFIKGKTSQQHRKEKKDVQCSRVKYPSTGRCQKSRKRPHEKGTGKGPAFTHKKRDDPTLSELPYKEPDGTGEGDK